MSRLQKPLEMSPVLYGNFAHLNGSPEDFLAFANKWGLLISGPNSLSDDVFFNPETGWHEPVSLWEEELGKIRMGITDRRDGDFIRKWSHIKIRDFFAYLYPSSEDGASLRIEPSSLISAMWLQFFQSVASDRTILTCEYCGRWFEAGPGTGKLLRAKYCSDRCRYQFHNERKKAAKSP